MALGIGGSIILARLLGPEKKGVVTTILVIPSLVVSFADLGIRQATTYFLGKRIYEDQAVISTLLFLTVLTSFIGIGAVSLIYVMNGLPQRYGWLVVSIPLLLLPYRLLATYGHGVLMAKQRIRAMAATNILSSGAYLALIALLGLTSSLVIETALLAEVLAAGLAVVYVMFIVRQYGHLRPAYIPGLPWRFLKRGFLYALALFILGLNYRLDIVLLERLASAREVGIYSVGVGLAEMLWLLPAALTTVNFARSAAARDSQAYAQKTARVMRVTFWGALPPCLLLYLVAPWLIPLVYGGAYTGSGVVVQAILLGIWMSLIFKVLNSDLAGRGRPEAALWVYALAVVINIGLNLWWIPVYGAVGSAWASSVSYTIGAIIFAAVYSRLSNMPIRILFLFSPADFKQLLPRPAR